jgi:hypothetical protein
LLPGLMQINKQAAEKKKNENATIVWLSDATRD